MPRRHGHFRFRGAISHKPPTRWRRPVQDSKKLYFSFFRDGPGTSPRYTIPKSVNMVCRRGSGVASQSVKLLTRLRWLVGSKSFVNPSGGGLNLGSGSALKRSKSPRDADSILSSRATAIPAGGSWADSLNFLGPASAFVDPAALSAAAVRLRGKAGLRLARPAAPGRAAVLAFVGQASPGRRISPPRN